MSEQSDKLVDQFFDRMYEVYSDYISENHPNFASRSRVARATILKEVAEIGLSVFDEEQTEDRMPREVYLALDNMIREALVDNMTVDELKEFFHSQFSENSMSQLSATLTKGTEKFNTSKISVETLLIFREIGFRGEEGGDRWLGKQMHEGFRRALVDMTGKDVSKLTPSELKEGLDVVEQFVRKLVVRKSDQTKV